jgi:hypothetical protein
MAGCFLYLSHQHFFTFFLTLLAENDGISCNGDIKDTKKRVKEQE